MSNSLAVIIDCWDNEFFYQNQTVDEEIHREWQKADQVFDSISQRIIQDANIKSVALACYDSARDDNKIVCEQPWWQNAESFFSKETKWDKLRKEWNNHGILISSQVRTDSRIKDIQLRNDQVGFSVFDSLHILYYCNVINPSIDNIIFMGQRFDLCVCHRPVGYFNVASLIHHGLFKNNITVSIYRDCVRCHDDFDISTKKSWTLISDNVYELNCTKEVNL